MDTMLPGIEDNCVFSLLGTHSIMFCTYTSSTMQYPTRFSVRLIHGICCRICEFSIVKYTKPLSIPDSSRVRCRTDVC